MTVPNNRPLYDLRAAERREPSSRSRTGLHLPTTAHKAGKAKPPAWHHHLSEQLSPQAPRRHPPSRSFHGALMGCICLSQSAHKRSLQQDMPSPSPRRQSLNPVVAAWRRIGKSCGEAARKNQAGRSGNTNTRRADFPVEWITGVTWKWRSGREGSFAARVALLVDGAARVGACWSTLGKTELGAGASFFLSLPPARQIPSRRAYCLSTSYCKTSRADAGFETSCCFKVYKVLEDCRMRLSARATLSRRLTKTVLQHGERRYENAVNYDWQ